MTYADYLRRYGTREIPQLRGGTAVTSRAGHASVRGTLAPRPTRTAVGTDWIAQARLRRLGIDVRI